MSLTSTNSKVGFNISVNEDGQLVFKTDEIRTSVCCHTLEPLVMTRAKSLIIARAVIAAQEESAT